MPTVERARQATGATGQRSPKTRPRRARAGAPPPMPRPASAAQTAKARLHSFTSAAGMKWRSPL